MANQKRGIILMNLGSPDSTEVRDLKKYLNEFLTDKRVIDILALQEGGYAGFSRSCQGTEICRSIPDDLDRKRFSIDSSLPVNWLKNCRHRSLNRSVLP